MLPPRRRALSTGLVRWHEGRSATDRPAPSAAAHLFQEAQRLEEEEAAAISRQAQRRLAEAQKAEHAWTGDESTRDAVLRMLVDAHKPLRIKGYEKEIQQPVRPSTIADDLAQIVKRESQDEDGNPLIIVRPRVASPEDAKPKAPWEVTYKVPETHREARVRHGVKLALTSNQAIKRDPGRLFAARDASIDYISGDTEMAKAKQTAKRYHLPGGARHAGQQGSMPTSIKGYVGFVEDRIERARQKGFFKNIKGRGKPMPHDPDASNPFIDTTERLMNRIVQRQGAAPPWVELQQELENEVQSWRKRVREAWRRRAVRMLSLEHGEPPSVEAVRAFRDFEWMKREEAYHEAGMRDLNNLMRRYNGAAPAAVRRTHMKVDDELEACFQLEAAAVHAELVRRHRLGPGLPISLPTTNGEMEGKSGGTIQNVAYTRPAEPIEGMWSALRRALGEFRSMRL